MKTKNLFLLPWLIASLSLIMAGRLTAQTLTITPLHSFSADDRANPYGGLVLSGNRLYGVTEGDEFDGTGFGTVFRIYTDGTGFTNLHVFNGGDGASPYARLVLAGDTLYGTGTAGGSSGSGTVFKVNIDGTGFTNLHEFAGVDGAGGGTLSLSGDTLYGDTYRGGDSGVGTLYKIHTDGTGFTMLHSFTATDGTLGIRGTNSDGANPRSGLVVSGDTLYGAASQGGSSGYGTLFRLNIDGSGFTTLHNFYADPALPPDTTLTNSEGVYLRSGLLLSGNTLYGTAQYGGTGAAGCVFAVNTDGTGFTNLHSFNWGTDGAYPRAGLVLAGNTLYGAAAWGGDPGSPGTLFALNTNGTGFRVLVTFRPISYYDPPEPSPNREGANPYGLLALADNTLYGTALHGGSDGYGTVFKVSLPAPQLTMTRSGPNVALTWPTDNAGFDYTGYQLKSTISLVPPVAWITDSPASVVLDGYNTVTIPISGPQKFYRLSQ
jgi:uncharacterized repeat protein (TIGR03803 family)